MDVAAAILAPESNDAERYILVRTHDVVAGADAEGHRRSKEEGRRDGETLKVLGLSASVGGDESNSGVEASKTGETTGDEKEEAELVKSRTEADRVSKGRWGDTEGNEIRKRVHLLTKHRAATTPARNLAIKSIEAEAKDRQQVRKVQDTQSFTGRRGGQVGRLDEVVGRRHDRECTTHAVHYGDQISKTEVPEDQHAKPSSLKDDVPDKREVTFRVLVLLKRLTVLLNSRVYGRSGRFGSRWALGHCCKDESC